MDSSIFKAYDIRGIVDKEFHIDNVYRLGRALAVLYKKLSLKVQKVIVGIDARPHSPPIKKELCRALQDSGLDVIYVGLVPTPVVNYGVYTNKADAGITITASHNAPQYNGLKCLVGRKSLHGDDLQALKKLYQEKEHTSTDCRGDYWELDLTKQYIDRLVSEFQFLVGADIPFVVDCANAAGATVVPELLRRLKLHNGRCIFETIEGSRPHHQANPAVEANLEPLKQAMLKSQAWFGAGLDGDADRMGMLDGDGNYVSADKVLTLFVDTISADRSLRVVMDVRSSQILAQRLRDSGVEVLMAPVGSPHIKQIMFEKNASIAGELSCHFMFADRYFGFDDGIYALLRSIELCVRAGKPIRELLKTLPRLFVTPEFRFDVEADSFHTAFQGLPVILQRTGARIETLDGVRASWEQGWGLVRRSNTEPVISMRFEGVSQESLAAVLSNFSAAFKELSLPIVFPDGLTF